MVSIKVGYWQCHQYVSMMALTSTPRQHLCSSACKQLTGHQCDEQRTRFLFFSLSLNDAEGESVARTLPAMPVLALVLAFAPCSVRGVTHNIDTFLC